MAVLVQQEYEGCNAVEPKSPRMAKEILPTVPLRLRTILALTFHLSSIFDSLCRGGVVTMIKLDLWSAATIDAASFAISCQISTSFAVGDDMFERKSPSGFLENGVRYSSPLSRGCKSQMKDLMCGVFGTFKC